MTKVTFTLFFLWQKAGPIAKRIGRETDTRKACQLLGDDWTKCVLESRWRLYGSYPTNQWKGFLDANGIEEQVTSTTSD